MSAGAPLPVLLNTLSELLSCPLLFPKWVLTAAAFTSSQEWMQGIARTRRARYAYLDQRIDAHGRHEVNRRAQHGKLLLEEVHHGRVGHSQHHAAGCDGRRGALAPHANAAVGVAIQRRAKGQVVGVVTAVQRRADLSPGIPVARWCVPCRRHPGAAFVEGAKLAYLAACCSAARFPVACRQASLAHMRCSWATVRLVLSGMYAHELLRACTRLCFTRKQQLLKDTKQNI